MTNATEELREVKVYSRNCLRDDYHAPVLSDSTRIALTFLTVGLFKLVEPVKCCACGKVRNRGFRSS